VLVCSTCGSRWDETAAPAIDLAAPVCPFCEGSLVAGPRITRVSDDAEPVHADVGAQLCEHLLDVGA